MANKTAKTDVDGQITLDNVSPSGRKQDKKLFLATCILSIGMKAKDGDIVMVRAEPDNEVDKHAVAVYNQAGEKIGYLANKNSTVRDGTKAASSHYKSITNKKTAAVYGKLSDYQSMKSGKAELDSFKLSLFFVPTREKKNDSIYTVEVYGGKVGCPGIPALREQLQAEVSKGNTNFSVPVTMFQRDTSTAMSIKTADGEISGSVRTPSYSGVTKEYEESYSAIAKMVRFSKSPVSGNVTMDPAGGKMLLHVTKSNESAMIDEAVDYVISNCIEQANIINEKVTFMRNAGTSDQIIAAVLRSYRIYDDENEERIPDPEYPFTESNGSDSGIISRCLAYHLHGKHIRLVGEKGCGKNTLIETICWLMRRPLFRLSGSSDLDKTDIIGSRTIENGTMSYELTEFLKTLEAGGDVDLDEANTIKPDIEVLIHSLTDQTRAINIPGYGMVKMDPDATFWMTLNEDYVGTTEMNDATVDRFVTIRLKAMADITTMLKARCPGASKANINFCQKVYTDMIACVNKAEITSTCISIRGFIDALECADYIPIEQSLMETLAAKPQDPDERKAIEIIISGFIA